MAAPREKFRLVLDYLPCDACLEVPVDDQELHCSICRRLSRDVAVNARSAVAVVVESPALPLPVEVPPAPPERVEVPPAPVVEAAAEVSEGIPVETPVEALVAEAVTPAEEEELELAFEATPPADEEEVEIGFEATRADEPALEATAPEPELEPVQEAAPYTFAPESLAEEDAAELDRAAEAWAEAAASEEEVELEPVRPEDLVAERAPEPEPWPEETTVAPPPPVEPAPAEAWPEEAEAEVLEVIEVVEETVAEPEPWTEAPPLEPGPAPAEAEVLEVLEVVEEEAVAPASPPPEKWEDDAWPEEAPAPVAEDAPWPAEAPPLQEEAWPEDAPPAPAPEPVEDPVGALDGVGPATADKLAAAGIRSVRDLQGRDAKDLAKATGLPAKSVQRWIGVADVQAMGIPLAYAEALIEAGYESPRDVRRGKPEKIAKGVNKALAARGLALDPVDAARVAEWQT